MSQQNPNDAFEPAIIRVYKDTRRRINAHAAANSMSQPEYVDSVVPPVAFAKKDDDGENK